MLDLSALSRLETGVAGFLSQVSALRGAFEIDIGGAAVKIALGRGRGDLSAKELIAAPMKSELGSFVLWFEQSLLDELCDIVLPAWREELEDALPLTWRGVATAHAIVSRTPLAGLGWSYEDFVVEGEERRPPASSSIELSVGWGGDMRQVLIEIASPPDARLAARYLPAPKPSMGSALDLFVDAELRLPTVSLDMASAARLDVGDVILPPGASLPEIPATLSVAGALTWSGALSAKGGFTFRQRLSREYPMDAMSAVEHPQNVEAAAPAEEGRPAGGGAGEDSLGIAEDELISMPVKLDIRLQSVSMPLSSFVNLAPGAVLELGADLSAPVDILGNGKLVGSGTLIQLDERIGVQIERWRKG